LGQPGSPVPRARIKAADALIAGAYLSGINTRRVRRALPEVFKGAVGPFDGLIVGQRKNDI
jgi:hypothetical protein